MSRQRISRNERSWAAAVVEPVLAMVAARVAKIRKARMRGSMPWR
jgi:hypothetical protein